MRVVVATHRKLEEQVKQGHFRQDLFHRIFVFPIVLPPLRERPEDIPALAAHFAAQIVKQNNWKEITFSPEALRALQAHSWPGNIRELRNVVERLLLFAEGDTVTPATVQAALPAQIGRRRGRGIFRDRYAGRARGAGGAADDPGRNQAPQSEHHEHGESAGPGAQPSL